MKPRLVPVTHPEPTAKQRKDVGRGRKWMQHQEMALSSAEAFAREYGGPGPRVALKPVAQACGVVQVQFRPLLAQGALAIRDEQFVILVRSTDSSEAARFTEAYERDNGLTLPSRLRFTIAHEIAHTFFYWREKGRLKRRLRPRGQRLHPSTLNSLERVCNLAAGQLLLPDRLLGPEISRDGLVDPQRIISFAGAAGVAVETLVVRLNRATQWGRNRGAIAVVEKGSEAEWRIETIAVDPFNRQRSPFVNLWLPYPLLEVIPGLTRLSVFGGANEQMTHSTSTGAFSYSAAYGRIRGANRYLLTVRFPEKTPPVLP